MIDRLSQVRRARTLISTLVHSNFFGEVVFKMEHGNVVCVEVGENRRVDSFEAKRLVEEPSAEQVTIRKRYGDISLARVSRKGSLEQMVPVTSPKVK